MEQKLTEEQIYNTLSSMSLSAFDTIFSKHQANKEGSDTNYAIRSSIITAIGLNDITELLLDDYGDLYDRLTESDDEEDLLDTIEETIYVLGTLKRFYTEDIVDQISVNDILANSAYREWHEKARKHEKFKEELRMFAENRAARKTTYKLVANRINIALKFYLYMKAFCLQGYLTFDEISGIIEKLGHVSNRGEQRLTSYDDSFNNLIKPIEARCEAKEKEIKDSHSTFINIEFEFDNRNELNNIKANLSRMLKDIYSVVESDEYLV